MVDSRAETKLTKEQIRVASLITRAEAVGIETTPEHRLLLAKKRLTSGEIESLVRISRQAVNDAMRLGAEKKGGIARARKEMLGGVTAWTARPEDVLAWREEIDRQPGRWSARPRPEAVHEIMERVEESVPGES